VLFETCEEAVGQEASAISTVIPSTFYLVINAS